MDDTTTAPDLLAAPLRRPRHGRVIGGVCAGLGSAWRTDPLAVRLVFLGLGLVAFPLGTLLYLVCWLLMPAQD